MPHALSRRETESLERMLEHLLATIRAGDLDASTAMTYRIEGAIVALEAVLGGSADQLLERLRALN